MLPGRKIIDRAFDVPAREVEQAKNVFGGTDSGGNGVDFARREGCFIPSPGRRGVSMIVGFTGTRHGMNAFQQQALFFLLKGFKPIYAHHGCCVGADEQFVSLLLGDESIARNIRIIYHPANSSALEFNYILRERDIERDRKDYLERNRDIVNESDVILACPFENTEIQRSGTWMTIRYAKKIKRPLIVILPCGSIDKFNVPESKGGAP